MKDITYNTATDFVDAVTGAIGLAEIERYLPLILPLAKNKAYKSDAFMDATGTISNTATPLLFGNGFAGYIDEIRIWKTGKTDEQMIGDYYRIMADESENIVGYWRCDENFGNYIYDNALSNGQYHKNDGLFSGAVAFSATNNPAKAQLTWKGITDANGDYTIPYIPYISSGENINVTPIYEQHVFKPSTRTVFIGEGNRVVSAQDFTDLSSFKITGTVFFENTFCGVEGAYVKVDGSIIIKDGAPIQTNDKGEFTASVPVGYHSISVEKADHVFKSNKFPPGPASNLFNFQEALNGINFIDITKVKIVGRVVGGTIEGDKMPGLGFSKNNIGVANFRFESATGPACTSYNISTDSKTGEYSVELPPMKYYVKGFDVPKNLPVGVYFNEKTFPFADFSIIKPVQTVSHTFSGIVNAIITIDKGDKTATLKIDGVSSPVVIYAIENAYAAGRARDAARLKNKCLF